MARSRPHVKVHLSVQHHEKTAEVWANAAQRGMLVELWRIGVEQYAPKRGGRVELMPLDRLAIAGIPTDETGIPLAKTENPPLSADDAVELLCQKLGYRLDKRPNRWTVTVRKFARKQGIGDTELPTKPDSLSHERLPQRAEAEADTESREQKGESSPVPGSLGLVVPDSKPVPILLWGEVNRTLRDYMPRASGLTLTPAREKRMLKIEKEFGDGSAVAALNGYAALHLTKPANGDFDPLGHFNPETCWRPANIGKYLDADRAARDSGLTPPYQAPTPADREADQLREALALQGVSL